MDILEEARRNKATLGSKLWRVQNLYRIRDKDRGLVKLKFNEIQQRILSNVEGMRPIRHFTLKYRQGGVSTFWLLWWLDDTITHANTVTGILADLRENLGYLWEIIKTAHAHMPSALQPKLGDDSKSVLTLPDRNSKMMVSLGFKSTPLHTLHVSEWAFCKTDMIAQSIAGCSPSSNITGETTPNGIGNDAYDTYIGAEHEANGFRRIFLPWWLQKEYRSSLNGMSPLARDKFELKLPLDDEQVLWRRTMRTKLKEKFDALYPEDDVSCWLASGNPYFNHRKVATLYREALNYEKNNNPWKEDVIYNTDDGHRRPEGWTAWEAPQPHDVYAAGADVAEGGAGDYSVLAIFNVTQRRQAFRFRGHMRVDSFYRLCAQWGKLYNKALLAIERNNHGHAVLLGLRESEHYQNLYVEKPDTRLIGDGPKEVKYGWLTTRENKAEILDHLKLAVEGEDEDDEHAFAPEFTVLDQEMCREMSTFKQEGAKLGAEEGKHDDVVMAWAIALQMYRAVRRRISYSGAEGIRTGEKLDSAK